MNETETSNPNKVRNIIIGLVVLSLVGGIYYFNNSKVQNNSEKQVSQEKKQEQGQGSESQKTEEQAGDKQTSQSSEDKKNATETTEQKNISANASLISSVTATISMEPKKAAEKAVAYVNKYVVEQGQVAKVAEVLPEKFTFYKFFMDVQNQKYPAYVSTDGKTMLSVQEYDLDKNPNTVDGKEYIDVDGGFQEVKGATVCKENGKPIVYFFGSENCAHCNWEKPIIAEVVKSFGDRISYHENIDSDKDKDVFDKFNKEGGIPTIVIGCKYFKIGSGESIGETKEKESLKNYISKVLN